MIDVEKANDRTRKKGSYIVDSRAAFWHRIRRQAGALVVYGLIGFIPTNISAGTILVPPYDRATSDFRYGPGLMSDPLVCDSGFNTASVAVVSNSFSNSRIDSSWSIEGLFRKTNIGLLIAMLGNGIALLVLMMRRRK